MRWPVESDEIVPLTREQENVWRGLARVQLAFAKITSPTSNGEPIPSGTLREENQAKNPQCVKDYYEEQIYTHRKETLYASEEMISTDTKALINQVLDIMQDILDEVCLESNNLTTPAMFYGRYGDFGGHNALFDDNGNLTGQIDLDCWNYETIYGVAQPPTAVGLDILNLGRFQSGRIPWGEDERKRRWKRYGEILKEVGEAMGQKYLGLLLADALISPVSLLEVALKFLDIKREIYCKQWCSDFLGMPAVAEWKKERGLSYDVEGYRDKRRI